MNGLFGGLLGLAMCCFTSLTSAQQADNTAPSGASSSAPSGAPSSAPKLSSVSRTVTLAPQEREYLPEPERHWYGWQTLALDGGAAILGLAALESDSLAAPDHSENTAQAMALLGAVAYGAGGPAIHLIHQRPWQALGSLGLRGGLPVLGGAIGLGSATCPPPEGDYGNCGLGPLIVGAATGALLAMVLDASLLAWEQPPADAPEQARLGLTPVVSSDGRRELRVFGTF